MTFISLLVVCWTLLHPGEGEEPLRGSWEDSELVATACFTCFTKA